MVRTGEARGQCPQPPTLQKEVPVSFMEWNSMCCKIHLSILYINTIGKI